MQKEIEKRIKEFRKKFNIPETPKKHTNKNKPQPQTKVKYRNKR